MSIGITNFNSKTSFTESLSIGKSEQLKIDQNGNINTIGIMDIFGKLTCNSELNITSISSNNSSITVDVSGNCLLNGTIYTKDNASFTNDLYLRNKSNQVIFSVSANNDSYLNISPVDQKIGFGTTKPRYFFHVAGQSYSENTIVNDKLIINPESLKSQNTDAYKLSVGGSINITGGLYINGNEIIPGKLGLLSEQLKSIINSGGGGGGVNFTSTTSSSSTFTSGNDINNGSIVVNGVKLPTWTSINSVLYYTEGNVGIGTTNPTFPFEVNGNTSIRGNVIYLYGSVYYNDRLLDEMLTGLWDKNSSNSFLIYTAFNTNSKVGIGIKEPEYKLDLLGDFHVTDDINADKNVFIKEKLGIGTQTPEYKLDVNGDLRVSGSFYVNGKKYTEKETQNVFWMKTVNSNNIYYLNRIGIQVTEPKYDLHVKGSFYMDGTSYFNGSTVITNLNIEDKFTFNSDRFVIRNSTGDLYTKGMIVSNNIYGDIPSDTKIINNNIVLATLKANTKLAQVKPSFSDGFRGIGISSHGMAFSDDGNSFAAVVPYGTDYSSNGTKIFNGLVQVYNWDTISNKWYMISTISTSLLDSSSSTSYSSSVAFNTDGKFLAVSAHTNTNYKVIFYIMDEDNQWSFINFLKILDKPDAGKYMIMEPNIKYLFLSEDKDNIELYINQNQNPNSNFDANFTKGTFNLLNNNYIGVINDIKPNYDCSIVAISSCTGAKTQVNNGTIACYAFWNSNGNPNILSSSPFIRLGKNIEEYDDLTNINSKKKSYFGNVCSISTHAKVDFKDKNFNNFEYDITLAVSTGGNFDPKNTPAYIKIYKFKYNTNNTSSGLIYPPPTAENTIPYIDGTWEQTGYLDHITYGGESGFGTDIKLNEDGTILFVGSPIENNIYVFHYDSNDKSWNMLNKIQGFKTGDMSIGYKLAYNYTKKHFSASSFKYATSDISDKDNYNYLGVSSEYNHIRIFNIEYSDSSSTF